MRVERTPNPPCNKVAHNRDMYRNIQAVGMSSRYIHFTLYGAVCLPTDASADCPTLI